MMALFARKTLTVAFVVRDAAPIEQSMIGLDKIADRVVIASIGEHSAAKRIAHDFGALYIELPSGTRVGDAKNSIIDRARTAWVLFLEPFDTFDPSAAKDLAGLMGMRGDAFVLYRKRYTKKAKSSLLPGFIPNTGSPMERGDGYLLSSSLCLVRIKDGIRHDALGDLEKSIDREGGTIGEAKIFIHDYTEFESSGAKSAATIDELRTQAEQTRSARAYFDLACAHTHAKNTDAALDAFQKASKADQNNVDILNNIGIVLAGRGERAKAIKVLLAALRIHPNEATSFNNPYPFSSLFATIGTLFAEQGEYRKAIVAYEKAIRMDHPDRELLQAHVSGMKNHLEKKLEPMYEFGLDLAQNTEDL